MMLLDSEVARTILGVFGFGLFYLLGFVQEKYVWRRSCSSDVALSSKKGLIGFKVSKTV